MSATEAAMTAPPDLGLLLPLSGVQLIEASAGTGKTHTLATLYLRLVLEARLPVDRLLAVTYTLAAAAELRDRLRQRLQQALDRLDAPTTENDAIAQLLRIAQQAESSAALRQRLRRAVAAMDAAPIYTIHAFCQRALADYALEAGQAATPREVVANETELRLEVATEFWRAQSRSRASTRLLEAWTGPRALATTLKDLLAVDGLEPAAPTVDDDTAELALAQAQTNLAEAFRRHGDEARQQLRRAGITGAVHRARSKDEAVDAAWASLALWQADPTQDSLLHKRLAWYGSVALRDKWNAKHGPLPVSPLFDAIDVWLDASLAATRARYQAQLGLLHALRAFGLRRLRQLKRARDRIGFDDLVTDLADALNGEHGEALVARLQRQYRVALVDEFQDTDARQSAIFARLFGRAAMQEDEGAARALYLIGDPKQAIYRFRGGDVTAYLLAARRAEAQHSLTHNFRSRPLALTALEALYRRAGDLAFAHTDIAFHSVQPGGTTRDEDFQRRGAIAPALNLVPLDTVTPDLVIDTVREAAAAAGARAILELLQDGATGQALRRCKDEALAPVQPGDIAVLVETHADAQTMRAALATLAIPAVIAGRDSVFASEEAEDLRRLLQALRAPADEGRLRAALATLLLGFDATALAALDATQANLPSWQETMQTWRERVLRHGPLALLNTLCAEQASRLLRLPLGERRLANYLQLGEALQELASGAPSIDALFDAFEQRIADADRENEDEQLRLESDAERVTIQTLHASKGLEFEFVFLPLIATRGASRRASAPEFARYHDGERRVLHLLGEDDTRDRELRALDEEEARAERLRLLYVGLTRARLATWIVWPRAKQVENTPLAWLLHRDPAGATVVAPEPARFVADLEALRAAAPTAIAVQTAITLPATRYRAATPESPPSTRRARRELSRDWWVYSYSALAREARGDEGAIEERGADDEVATVAIDERSRFVGTRFGHALHAALERSDFARWRDLDLDAVPPPETDLLTTALREQGYAGEVELAEGRALLARLIHATVNVALPEGGRLCELDAEARRDELEFHLHLAPTAIADLIAVLHAHDVVNERQGFGARRRIEGLLTGRIDLVYARAGRYYVLDYKSNRLADYRPAALAEAVRDSEYDLQYVLYTLALHRWLRFRLGAAYDYDRDFGGVRYLFCRGLDPTSNEGSGIHALRPPRALIEALDALFGKTEAAA